MNRIHMGACVSQYLSHYLVTTELYRYPEGEGGLNSSFDWRVSMASVKENGQFSSFPGYDRSLAIVAGEGLLIRVGKFSEWFRIERTSSPFQFSGDEETEAQLLKTESEVFDFNVFTRRQSYSHQLAREILPPNFSKLFLFPSLTPRSLSSSKSTDVVTVTKTTTLFLCSLGGKLDLKIERENEQKMVTLEAGDSCVIGDYHEGSHAIQLMSHTHPVELFAAQFTENNNSSSAVYTCTSKRVLSKCSTKLVTTIPPPPSPPNSIAMNCSEWPFVSEII
jgi:environmental stress-induced protein Ves